jgi:hypothetical protein
MEEAQSEAEPAPPRRPRRCGDAVAGAVLGALAVCTWCIAPAFGIPAVAYSHWALARIRRSRGTLTGRRLAWAGLAMGYAALLAFAVMLALVRWGTWGHQPDPAVRCASNAKQIALAFLMYAEDNGGFLPMTLEETLPYLGEAKTLRCPGVAKRASGAASDYRYLGQGLALTRLEKPAQTVLLADRPGNHPAALVVGFADGHIETVRASPDTPLEQVAEEEAWILPGRP